MLSSFHFDSSWIFFSTNSPVACDLRRHNIHVSSLLSGYVCSRKTSVCEQKHPQGVVPKTQSLEHCVFNTVYSWWRRIMNASNLLRWRHNGCNGVSNRQPHDCFLKRLLGADQRKHQSSASLAFVRRIHRWPVNSPRKRPVTRKMFPFDDVIMLIPPLWSKFLTFIVWHSFYMVIYHHDIWILVQSLK